MPKLTALFAVALAAVLLQQVNANARMGRRLAPMEAPAPEAEVPPSGGSRIIILRPGTPNPPNVPISPPQVNVTKTYNINKQALEADIQKKLADKQAIEEEMKKYGRRLHLATQESLRHSIAGSTGELSSSILNIALETSPRYAMRDSGAKLVMRTTDPQLL